MVTGEPTPVTATWRPRPGEDRPFAKRSTPKCRRCDLSFSACPGHTIPRVPSTGQVREDTR